MNKRVWALLGILLLGSFGWPAMFVAGAVPGLAAADVSVVSAPAPASARPADKELRRVGPITVTRASLSPLRVMAAGAVLLNLLLLGAVLLLWSKVRRTEDALGQARAAGDAAAR